MCQESVALGTRCTPSFCREGPPSHVTRKVDFAVLFREQEDIKPGSLAATAS